MLYKHTKADPEIGNMLRIYWMYVLDNKEYTYTMLT